MPVNQAICPKCGALLELSLSAKESPEKVGKVETSEILALFPARIRSKLEVAVEGNFAHVELKGRFNKKTWNKILAEVRGYGGRYVKGYFSIPLAGAFGE